MNWFRRGIFLWLAILTSVLFLANIFFGSVHIPTDQVIDVLTGRGEPGIAKFIILGNRMPMAITAMFGGAALAVTGLMLQTAFRNPLAGPSILGISSGASLGVALVMLAMDGVVAIGESEIGGYAAVIAAAIAGSLLITGILTLISLRVKNTLMLLIVGILTGYLTSSIVTLLSSLAESERVHGYVMWGMGSFSQVSTDQLPWMSIFIIICLGASLLLAKPLNILLLGDNYARNLGVRVDKVKTLLLIVTGVMTAIVTAYCGPVAFIGLAMPHVARMLTRTDNHWVLMPATMLAGSAVALGCNILSVLPSHTVIPLNALTPLVGVPVILYVILSANRKP